MDAVFEEPTGQYHVVSETDRQRFETNVSVLHARGWLCVGGVVFQTGSLGTTFMHQSMAKMLPMIPTANATEIDSMTAALGKAYADIASLKALLAERDKTIRTAEEAKAAEAEARRADRLAAIADLQRELQQHK